MIVTSRGHTEDHLARVQEFEKRLDNERQRDLFRAHFVGAICALAGDAELRRAIDSAIEANQKFVKPSQPLAILINEALLQTSTQTEA